MDDFMSQWAVEKPRGLRMWTWQDSTKIVDFMTLHLKKSEKYGLDIPITNNANMTKDELKAREDELTAYFLHEMRKKPVA